MAKFSNFDMKMFEKAREVANTSEFEHFHLGCVITYKHHILSTACNSYKTHPVQMRYNQRFRQFRQGSKPCVHSLHAEIAALSTIPYPIASQINWHEVKVYIYRISVGRESQKGMARPCPACEQALRELGIRHIYYTTNSGYAYEKWDDWVAEE